MFGQCELAVRLSGWWFLLNTRSRTSVLGQLRASAAGQFRLSDQRVDGGLFSVIARESQFSSGCPQQLACAFVQVRTQTLVKNAIIQVDATPFKQFYSQHYGNEIGIKKNRGGAAAPAEAKEPESHSNHVKRKLAVSWQLPCTVKPRYQYMTSEYFVKWMAFSVTGLQIITQRLLDKCIFR